MSSTTDHNLEKRRLGDFEIVGEIGRGGMGVVYEARQVSLNRRVALKVLAGSLGLTHRMVLRFHHEAEAAAKLHHTNIVPVYATGEHDGTHFYAMELIDGPSLDCVLKEIRRLAAGASREASMPSGGEDPDGTDLVTTAPYHPGINLSVSAAGLSSSSLSSHTHYFDTVARMVAEVADALDYAHQNGIIHRDIKPSNLILGAGGRLSITDFGLARTLEHPGMTVTGEFVGTPAYMSPEQIAAGRAPLDHRTDIYSLGASLYQLLTLCPPFPGPGREQVIAQILSKEPQPPRRLNPKVPVDLQTICLKALEKDPDRRYQTAGQLAEDLRRYLNRFAISARRAGVATRAAKFIRRHRLGVAATAALLLLAITAGILAWKYHAEQDRLTQERVRAEDQRWVRQEALPEIRRLIREENYWAATDLAGQAEFRVLGDPTLAELRHELFVAWSVVTDPPGAAVHVRPYGDAQAGWQYLGLSPLDRVPLPRGFLHWRVAKDGYVSVEGCRDPRDGTARFTLDREGSLPPEMVRVAGNQYRLNLNGTDHLDAIDLEDFFIDRYEVTNREFQRFVEQGGYRRREYWTQPFVKGDAVLSWEAALREFRDATGKPGPAAWQLGTYPAGEDDYPVRGVSWYEAAAYAAFAGKSLPTVAHWVRASGIGYQSEIVSASRYGGPGPIAVGSLGAVGPFGTHDMAGNVSEWCWNGAGGDKRYVLGGAWNETSYMFYYSDAQAAFDRSLKHGFRCARYGSDKVPAAALVELPLARREFGREKPVSDEAFQAYKSMYAYDKGPLNSEVVAREETENWLHETVRFDAAYGNERVIAHLFLPRNIRPPYQVIVFFPGINAKGDKMFPGSDKALYPVHLSRTLKSGRAVLWPVYKGTFERRIGLRPGWSYTRDLEIQMAKDLRRSLDYLERRSDIDPSRIAYLGFSWGARLGNLFLAVEDRFRVAVLASGGFPRFKEPLPEIDELNFAPRVTIPVLMINGRNDGIFDAQTAQRAMFELLGTPREKKRHLLVDAGHTVPADLLLRETNAWLDRYLGQPERSPE